MIQTNANATDNSHSALSVNGRKPLLKGWQFTAISKRQKGFIPITSDTRQVDKCSIFLIFPRHVLRASMRCHIRRVKGTRHSSFNQIHQLNLFFWHFLNILLVTVLVIVLASVLKLKCGYDCGKFWIGCKALPCCNIGEDRVKCD